MNDDLTGDAREADNDDPSVVQELRSKWERFRKALDSEKWILSRNAVSRSSAKKASS